MQNVAMRQSMVFRTVLPRERRWRKLPVVASMSLAGIGGQFFDSTGWRPGFVALLCGLIVLSLLMVLVSARAWRDRTLPTRSRVPVMLTAFVGFVLGYTSSVHSIPSVWKI